MNMYVDRALECFSFRRGTFPRLSRLGYSVINRFRVTEWYYKGFFKQNSLFFLKSMMTIYISMTELDDSKIVNDELMVMIKDWGPGT